MSPQWWMKRSLTESDPWRKVVSPGRGRRMLIATSLRRTLPGRLSIQAAVTVTVSMSVKK